MKFTLRYTKCLSLIFLMTLLTISFSYAQTRKIVKVHGGKKSTEIVKIEVDSLYKDSLRLDSLRMDSLKQDSLKMDSLRIDSLKVDSLKTLSHKGKKWVEPVALKTSAEKFSFVRDTISPTANLLISLVPGVGQIYNRQWHKTPIFIGLIGGFAAGGIIASSKYNSMYNDWKRAVDLNLPSEVTDPMRRKLNQMGTVRTLFISAAAITYLYQVADATLHYRGYLNPVRKATLLSAIFPGAGFVYAKTYWRLPIYYGAFAVTATVFDYNNRYFQRYRDAYNAMTDGDPSTEDEFHGRYSAETLANARDAYRRDRDLGIICMVGVYALNIIDTYVMATLKNWDVSTNLSVKVQPTIFREYAYMPSGGYPSGTGLTLKIKF